MNFQTSLVGTDLFGAHVYWSNFSGDNLMRINIDGTGEREIVRGQQPTDVSRGIAKNGNFIYWTDFPNQIRRSRKNGSEQIVLVDNLANAADTIVVVNDEFIYWQEYSSGVRHIKRCNLDGTSVNLIHTDSGSSYGLGSDGTYIYWGNSSGTKAIKRCELDGSNPTTLVNIASADALWGVTVEGNFLYWNTQGGFNGVPMTVKRANLDGSNITTLVSSLADSDRGCSAISVTDEGIYVMKGQGLGANFIARCELDGSNYPQILVTDLDYPWGLEVG